MTESQSNYAIDPTPMPDPAPRILTDNKDEQIDGLLTCLEALLSRIRDLEAQVSGLTYRHETHIHATTGAVLDIADEAERC